MGTKKNKRKDKWSLIVIYPGVAVVSFLTWDHLEKNIERVDMVTYNPRPVMANL